MHITLTLETVGETLHIHSFADRCPNCVDATIAFADEWSASRFLQRHRHDAACMARLRAALAADVVGLDRLTDDDVIAAGAWRLGRGAWKVSRHAQRQSTGGGGGGGGGGAASAAGSSAAASAAPGRSPTPAAARTASPAAAMAGAAVAAPAEWPEAADQIAQAQTLERAAQSGAPFCEICEQRRRERAGAAA